MNNNFSSLLRCKIGSLNRQNKKKSGRIKLLSEKKPKKKLRTYQSGIAILTNRSLSTKLGARMNTDYSAKKNWSGN